MKSLKIVVVDDTLFMRTLLKRMLQDVGHEVVGEAGNGLEAIKAVRRLKPDIVTMDITMPDMNGIVAVKEILAIYPEMKIIMVSAMGQQAMVVDAIKNGAKDFIVKPFEKSRIVEAIKNVQMM